MTGARRFHAAALAVAACLAIAGARADPLVVVPPCADWRVSRPATPPVRLYCGSTGATWLTLAAACDEWRASRDRRGWLVLTCVSGACAGMAVAVYPRPL